MTNKGRPSETYNLSPRKTRLFCEAIAVGKTVKYACEYAGFSQSAFHRYKSQFNNTDSYALMEFRDAYNKAVKQAEERRMMRFKQKDEQRV